MLSLTECTQEAHSLQTGFQNRVPPLWASVDAEPLPPPPEVISFGSHLQNPMSQRFCRNTNGGDHKTQHSLSDHIFDRLSPSQSGKRRGGASDG